MFGSVERCPGGMGVSGWFGRTLDGPAGGALRAKNDPREEGADVCREDGPFRLRDETSRWVTGEPSALLWWAGAAASRELQQPYRQVRHVTEALRLQDKTSRVRARHDLPCCRVPLGRASSL